ncbi:hypothetical protein HOLleu_44969 [Holothuria leucospilota]|uniref:Uncharacterized protein n=1 Tax=Holothuria leucospilota TaxID=206669 RepID=A0A9Q0YAA7_HOLLE|nr:hypothetical protein HOLleu_44969 [Holothuria leucospilota]
MHAICYGLSHHFQATLDVDILRSDLFKESNNTYKAMLVKPKQSGKRAVKHKNAVSKEDMGKILDSLDITIPEGLQNKVFLDIMMYFANHDRENLRSMSIFDFHVQVDEQNLWYIVRCDTLNRDVKMRMKTAVVICTKFLVQAGAQVTYFLALKEVLNPEEQCM